MATKANRLRRGGSGPQYIGSGEKAKPFTSGLWTLDPKGKEEPHMALYCGMDLHSNNTYTVILDDQDHALLDRRLPNRLEVILSALKPFAQQIHACAVESTFNWYWLVDGLMETGYRTQLVNTNAVQQYDGLKFTDDRHDARWIAHLMRASSTGSDTERSENPGKAIDRSSSTNPPRCPIRVRSEEVYRLDEHPLMCGTLWNGDSFRIRRLRLR